ncbi:hypothetical protein HH310_06725 [Actinoplanes sp. TBRC 11911]|uniref:hypothetical protein n=1 Tax=Actinoplanes sp. TBRC 11911 TaxID=2729386 RepID=UPI00145D2C50|nr:hypothetical protein [Actinoplanes sp. TBRC 11911]NMO50887.1 hypothetical protein [Actinoplanes sp. TBRC 11911]
MRLRLLTLVSSILMAIAGVAGVPAVASAAAANCGGTLAFGQIAECPSINGADENVYWFTTTKPNDIVHTMLTRGSGGTLQARITGPTGAQVCFVLTDSGQCQLKAAGTYKLTVFLYFQDSGDYTLALQSTRTPSSCNTLPASFFSFASAGTDGNLPAGSAGDCYRFNQPVGSVLHLWDPAGAGDVQGDILDAANQPVCQVRDARECTLTTAGPYTLNLLESYGTATPYTLRMPRLSNAAGCGVLKPAAFGDPGADVGSGSLDAKQGSIACNKVHVPAAGPIGVRIASDGAIADQVYDDAGKVVCQDYRFRYCDLPAEGDYTVITSNQDWTPISYRIALPSLTKNTGCVGGTSLSWASDALSLRQVSAVQTNCRTFAGSAGDRVVTYRSSAVASWLVDSTGHEVCGTPDYTEDGCVLPASGTYRVISYLDTMGLDGDETYPLQVRRLSQPAGCPVIKPGTYNADPAGAMGPIRCRVLAVTKPGTFQIRSYDANNYEQYATVYDGTGHRICDDSSRCDLPAAGRYTMVLDGDVIDNDFRYVTAFLPIQPSGCPAVGELAQFQAEFSTPGQHLCREIDLPSGSQIVRALPGDAQDSTRPFAYVVNADGDYLCDTWWALDQDPCELSGTAPYSVVFREDLGNPPAAFNAAFVRTNDPSSCATLLTGTTTSDADRFATCYRIDADQHTSRETITWHRTSGDSRATMAVFNATTGQRLCGSTVAPFADRTITCNLPNEPLTVLFEAGTDGSQFQIGRQSA